MDCHSSSVYYTKTSSGVAGSGVSWTASLFGTITNTIGSLNVGSTVTYPQFVVTPDNLLQFVYRSGVSGNGNTQLAEYQSGTWSNVGLWASGSGTYTADKCSHRCDEEKRIERGKETPRISVISDYHGFDGKKVHTVQSSYDRSLPVPKVFSKCTNGRGYPPVHATAQRSLPFKSFQQETDAGRCGSDLPKKK
ncbi:hypothetical protein ARMSODRAFT_976361 [Armillaria solidipes]|uniref:Uncharacterized protein n=1 Tax=Armillaria solidipes TaxID=1076256 RepID=A0A2H3BGP8_9AGAR|nr:hypothetical protein ARMSODRAFT_976361 [Armillaria solidipes]